jgi:hypothetical protein
MPASNGGMAQQLGLILIPNSTTIYSFLDPTNFNDPNSSSFYDFKVEQVIPGRIPTLGQLILSYRDLGVATILINVTGTNDQGKAVNWGPNSYTIGNAVPLNIILTKVIGVGFSAQNLQVSIIRNANAGPISITGVRLEGHIEKTVYA